MTKQSEAILKKCESSYYKAYPHRELMPIIQTLLEINEKLSESVEAVRDCSHGLIKSKMNDALAFQDKAMKKLGV